MSILKQTHQGYVCPALEHGMVEWGTCLSQMEKLIKVQNQNFRLITEGMKPTHIMKIETLTGLESLNETKDKKILIQYTKVKSHTQQPLHAGTKKTNKRRLKTANFTLKKQKTLGRNSALTIQQY